MTTNTKRVGIFSGTFDPVHRGHVEACVVALGALELDTVLILIEKTPKHKKGVAKFIDRANMLELATSDYPSLRLVDLDTDNITTGNTLDYLGKNFADQEYWYIVGSDMLDHIEDWPGSAQLFENMNLCVVLRENSEQESIEKEIKRLQYKHKKTKFFILPSVWSPVSSSTVKQALQTNQFTTAIDPAVQEYIRRHRLYLQP